MGLQNILKLIWKSTPPIHEEGHRFIYIFGVVTIVLSLFSSILGFIGVVLTVWCAYFFRDPDRIVPIGDNFIVSPADGVISNIEQVAPPEELGLGEDKVTRISVFLNVFNVHINRFPATGEIVASNYHPGKFLSADLDKASSENERQSVVIKTKEGGHELVCVQIAGLIARRIVYYPEDGQKLQAGERYGLIRFGSRVDLYLPAGVSPKVAEGQLAVAGETVFADLKSKTAVRKGEMR